MHEKEPQDPSKHTSEHVTYQHFLGRAPRPPCTVHIAGPHFLYLPWAWPILYNNHTVTKFQNNASCSLSASVQTCPSFNHMGGNIWLDRKGTRRCSGSVANMGLGFEYSFNKWPRNTSVVHFYALNGLRAESNSFSILVRVIYDGSERQQSMLDECFQHYP